MMLLLLLLLLYVTGLALWLSSGASTPPLPA
jgi:hypothetical protein